MTDFLQAVVNGFGQGSIYALLALGYVMIYKATKVISFAQPALMTVGGLLTYHFTRVWELPFTTYRDLTEKPEVRELVQKVVDETNTKFAAVETIKHFALIPKELDHDEGELTATQKVRRSAVTAQFEDVIESMYGPVTAGERNQ